MMSAFTSFGAGWLRKRLSIAAVLIVSTFLTVVGMLGFALSPVWLVLLVAVLPYGLGAGAIDACLNDYVAKNYSSRQMNWLHACWGIGASLGPAIMTVAVTRFNWQKGYVFIAVLQMILLLFLFSLENVERNPGVGSVCFRFFSSRQILDVGAVVVGSLLLCLYGGGV